MCLLIKILIYVGLMCFLFVMLPLEHFCNELKVSQAIMPVLFVVSLLFMSTIKLFFLSKSTKNVKDEMYHNCEENNQRFRSSLVDIVSLKTSFLPEYMRSVC